MNLRFRLNLIVTLVLLIILGFGAINAIQNARENVRAEVESTMEFALTMLSSQLANLSIPNRVIQNRSPFRLERLADVRHLNIQYFDADNQLIESSAPKSIEQGGNVPQWFTKLMHDNLDDIPVKAIPVYINSVELGRLVVSPKPDNEIEEAWDETKTMLGMITLFFIAVNTLVYLVVAQALKPITLITSALSDIESGNLDTRLPIFKLPEMASISHKFNLMASALQSSTRNNHRLTQQIIRLQEAERKSLAQELHDEIGQHLTAIHVDASAIMRCKEINLAKRSAEAIDEVATQMMDILRSMLQRLRPGGLDDLGFIDALHMLMSNWQERHSNIDLNYQFDGEFFSLPEAVQLTIYRVIQECFTNISRHAHASDVEVTLTEDKAAITLTISDNGRGFDPSKQIPHFGLAGMQERIDSVNGSLHIQTQLAAGVIVKVTIPN